jgi:hypothetical protein
VGLCTGLLAASAVASARSLSELIPVAVEAVRISFRTGTCVGAAATALGSGQESWSTILAGTSEQAATAALKEFHQTAIVSISKQAYVSAVSGMAVTISGPPSTLELLFRNIETLGKKHRISIPVYAPYHAEHMYSSNDIACIIDENSRNLLRGVRPSILIHSASTGKCQTATNGLDLFAEARTLGLSAGRMRITNYIKQRRRLLHNSVWCYQCDKQPSLSPESRRADSDFCERLYIMGVPTIGRFWKNIK